MKKSSSTLIRAVLPHPIDTAIKHLAVDLGIPVTKLMVEASILLLRYHDRGHGLPEPMPPCTPGDQDGTTERPAKKSGRAKKGGN
jgi:hypothetical protein